MGFLIGLKYPNLLFFIISEGPVLQSVETGVHPHIIASSKTLGIPSLKEESTKIFDFLKYLRGLLKLPVRNTILFSKNVGQTFNKSSSKDLYKDLDHARVSISYSSNSLVETVCEGVPTITLSKTSHAWPVSSHKINVLEETTMPTYDRTQWLYDTAYTQWKMSEINTGEVHKRLL